MPQQGKAREHHHAPLNGHTVDDDQPVGCYRLHHARSVVPGDHVGVAEGLLPQRRRGVVVAPMVRALIAAPRRQRREEQHPVAGAASGGG